MNKWVPEQPSPWRKSSKRESCYGDRVYNSQEAAQPYYEIPLTYPPARDSDTVLVPSR